MRKLDWRRLHCDTVKDAPSQVVQHVAFKCNKSMGDVKHRVDFGSAGVTQGRALQSQADKFAACLLDSSHDQQIITYSMWQMASDAHELVHLLADNVCVI